VSATLTEFDRLPDVLTVPELQAYLRIGRRQAYELVRSGAIYSVRVSSAIRIPKSALAQYLAPKTS
jgi:excisionase family DNA binding protein